MFQKKVENSGELLIPFLLSIVTIENSSVIEAAIFDIRKYQVSKYHLINDSKQYKLVIFYDNKHITFEF
jgi:hypothetical protein